MTGRDDGSFSSDDLIRRAWEEIDAPADGSDAPDEESADVQGEDLDVLAPTDEVDEPADEEESISYLSFDPDPPEVLAPPPAEQTPVESRPRPRREERPRPAPSRPDQRPAEGRRPNRAGVGFLAVLAIAGGLRLLSAIGESSDTATSRTTVDAASLAEPAVFFDDFSSFEGLTLRGSARAVDDVISLTRKEPLNQAGAVWLEERQPVSDGFETAFVFEIDHISWWTIGTGFSFVIQNSRSATPLGGSGSSVGYGGIASSVAIEFDTVRHSYESDPTVRVRFPNSPPAPLANHAAIHTMGRQPNDAHARARVEWVALEEDVFLFDRNRHLALIRYAPGVMSLFVDDLEAPVMVADLDLDELLGLTDGTAWVGFTAGTEVGFYSDHQIIAWVFDSPCLPDVRCGDA